MRGLRTSINPYFIALRRAHKMHHKHLGKEEGECFGMLVVPFKYYRDTMNFGKGGNRNARNEVETQRVK